MVWLIVVLVLIVLIVLWVLRKRWRRNKAIQILLHHSQRLSSDPALPPFVITDYFELEGQQHVDLAFIANEATIEYVRDVNRVA